MSGSEKTVVQTIIKRKIRNPEEPQENGGWKVAYANFVTAMMAFFMVMWLLSSANEDQRRGIAGYFRPSSDLNRAETGSLSMVDKGILHGGDTLDAAVEDKLESVEAQSSSADEPHQNATQKDLKAIKTLFSDLYKEKLGRPLSEAQIGLHLSDEGFAKDQSLEISKLASLQTIEEISQPADDILVTLGNGQTLPWKNLTGLR